MDYLPLEVLSILSEFDLKIDQYRNIMKVMESEMNKGLSPETQDSAEIKMLPSFVTRLPSGNEEGQYLALTLGNNNCHLILVTLKENKSPDVFEKVYLITENMKNSDCKNLFKFMAENVKIFIQGQKINMWPLKMGLIFSFPCSNISLTEAKLLKWTKEFSVKKCEGQNVVSLLQEALDKLNVNVKCVAAINDTVANLIYGAHLHEHCYIGVILGTGTNAAYLEEVSKVKTLKGSLEDKNMVINMELGAFGDQGFLNNFRTKYDRKLDEQSNHQGEHIYEKMISGMYIGELVRLILLDLTKKNLLFGGKQIKLLETKDIFKTAYISEAGRDLLHKTLEHTYNVINKNMGVVEFNNADAAIIKAVCQKVITRSAYLVGTGIACLLNRIKRKEVVVAIDGSLFKFHPMFEEYMIDMIYQFKEPWIKFQIKSPQVYKGEGAAILAATLD